MPSKDPEILRLNATIAAREAVSRLDTEGRRRRVEPANEGRHLKYLDAVDPDRTMSEEDRIEAAKSALAADMARLSLMAVQAKKRKAAERRELAKAS